MAMESRTTIAGHPIHPMLVVFPIGLFVFSFVADLFWLGTGASAWRDVAYYTMGGGILGGLAAAVPGAMDLFSLPHSKARRVGLWHMTINITVLVLFAVNFWLRSDAPVDDSGLVWLSLIGVALLGVSGWLGGEMVYVHGVGVGRSRAERIESEARRAQASRR